MNNENVKSIVLRRTNYGEADKIITTLTHTGKKVSLIAKGVRKPKSKLVAGTELFCVSDICYIQGKGSMGTLTSAQILQQHTSFLGDLQKVKLAYDVIKIVDKHTEDIEGDKYFEILQHFFACLDDAVNDVAVVHAWVWLQILRASGHQMQLLHQTNGDAFNENAQYAFDIDGGGFIESVTGKFYPDHIKFLRIAQNQPLVVLQRVQNGVQIAKDVDSIIKQFVDNTY